MKKIFDKKIIYGVIIGSIITSGIGVLANNYLYLSKNISYTPSDSSWNVDNVEKALDDLFNELNTGNEILKIVTNENRTAGVKNVEFIPTSNCRQLVVGGRRYGGVFDARIIDSNGKVLSTTSIQDAAGNSGVNTASSLTLVTVPIELEKGKKYYLSSTGQGTSYNLFSFVIYP